MIEKVKENEMTVASGVAYIRALDLNGNSVRIDKSNFMSENSLISGLRWSTGTGGLFKVMYKVIGISATEVEESLLLICPIIDINTTKENLSGCVGQFYFLRGGAGAGLTASPTDVCFLKGYNTIKAYKTALGNPLITSLGYCTYNGIMYLAIKFDQVAYFDIIFSGIYSGNCVFKPAALSAVIWKGDL